MCSYAVEGAAAEWGSLLLFTVKGASEQTAALVLGVFASATAICRLGGDYLRTRLGDFTISFGGSLLAACGMGIVLISPWPVLCLADMPASEPEFPLSFPSCSAVQVNTPESLPEKPVRQSPSSLTAGCFSSLRLWEP